MNVIIAKTRTTTTAAKKAPTVNGAKANPAAIAAPPPIPAHPAILEPSVANLQPFSNVLMI